jgi:hypothetical protein
MRRNVLLPATVLFPTVLLPAALTARATVMSIVLCQAQPAEDDQGGKRSEKLFHVISELAKHQDGPLRGGSVCVASRALVKGTSTSLTLLGRACFRRARYCRAQLAGPVPILVLRSVVVFNGLEVSKFPAPSRV